MSTDYYTFLGPYVICTNQSRNVIKEVNACPNNTCCMFGIDTNQFKFCPECGNKIIFFEVELKERLNVTVSTKIHYGVVSWVSC